METFAAKCTCEQCQLKSLFFSHVSPDDLYDICEIKTEKIYTAGDIIIQEGEPIHEFLYMKEGLVKLSRKTANSREQIISFSKPFDFVSLLSVFSSDKYRYSVTALENTTVCLLDLIVIKKYTHEHD